MQSTTKFPGKQSTFGNRIEWLRETLQLSMRDFALVAECDRSYIYKLEHGFSKNPSPDFVVRVCLKFNARRAWMQFGEGSPFDSQSSVNVAQEAGKIVALAKLSKLWREPVENLSKDEHKELARAAITGDRPTVIGLEAFEKLSIEQLREVVHHFTKASVDLPLFLQTVYTEIAAQASIEFRRRVALLSEAEAKRKTPGTLENPFHA